MAQIKKSKLDLRKIDPIFHKTAAYLYAWGFYPTESKDIEGMKGLLMAQANHLILSRAAHRLFNTICTVAVNPEKVDVEAFYHPRTHKSLILLAGLDDSGVDWGKAEKELLDAAEKL